MGAWLESVPAAQVALLMVSLQQLILGLGWLVSAGMMGPNRVGVRWAAVFALLTGFSIATFVLAVAWQADLARALGNVGAVLSMLALQRAVWAFIGQAPAKRLQAAMLALALALLGLLTWTPEPVWRIVITSAFVVWATLHAARDTWRYAVRELDRAWGLLFVVPLLLMALVFALRGLRMGWQVGGPVRDMAINDASRVGLATVTMVTALGVQVTLVALLVTRQLLALRDTSQRDGLTGLFNRRAMDEQFQAEVQRARRLGVPFSVLLVDADHFKQINDRHGHAGGDRALLHLAGVMNGTLRDIDRLGRWGGEEFVVLLPATRVEDACVLAERLRERVAATPAPWGGQTIALTVSLGAAQWQVGDDAQAVLARADQALYRAKNAGRNRVMQ